MANDAIPINGNVVTWARERAGMSPQEAADKFAHIAGWESGAAKPTYPQLEKLADDLKVPIAVFFFPEPPSTPPIRESFRTLPDVEFATIPRHVRLLLRKAKAFQLNLSELAPQGRNPAQRLITRELRFGTEANLEDMSRRVRDWLGVSIDEQMAWSDDDTALKTWRDVLQRAGVFVFKDAFRG